MSGLVEYPFSLGGNRGWVFLRLPSDFNAADCQRVVAFLQALVLPESHDAVDPHVEDSGPTSTRD